MYACIPVYNITMTKTNIVIFTTVLLPVLELPYNKLDGAIKIPPGHVACSNIKQDIVSVVVSQILCKNKVT